MKKVVFSITMLSVLSLNAQTEPPVKSKGAVGINTHEPRASLDINGDLRLQEAKLMAVPNSTVEKFTDCPCVLTMDEFGVVQRIPLSQFANVGGGTGGSTLPPSGGGTGSADMEGTQTIHIASIKDTGVDHQGVINNGEQKIRFTIPYTNGNNGTYNAVNTTVTSNATAGENGDINPLQLTIDSGTFASSGGNITGTITVGGDGTLNVKKQALPTSSSDFEAKKLDVATFYFKLGMKTYSLKIVGTSGIPDRCFGKTTLECVGYGANEKEHEFIYVPIQGPDGKTWLNNNLGAEYAKVGSSDFNPAQQATSKTDWKAYGSLFQWQRQPDGHELINWSSETDGTSKYTVTESISNSWTNAETNQFIAGNSSNNYSWVNDNLNSASTQKNLWQSGGSTNPCPSGYRVPTHTELTALHNAVAGRDVGDSSSKSSELWGEQVLRLPASGLRYDYSNVGAFGHRAVRGYIWSSDTHSTDRSYVLWFGKKTGYTSTGERRGGGIGIRCIKDN